MPVGMQETSLAPRFSRVLCLMIWVIGALTFGSLIQYGHPEPLLRAAAPIALVAVGAWTLFWNPRLRLDPAGLDVVNPLRTYRVSWAAITDVKTRWALTLLTASQSITVWAAPAQSPYGSLSGMNRDPLGRAMPAPVRPRDLPTSVAGLAPALVTRQWNEYHERGLVGSTDGPGVTSRLHLATAIALIGLAVLTIASIAWP